MKLDTAPSLSMPVQAMLPTRADVTVVAGVSTSPAQPSHLDVTSSTRCRLREARM